MKKKNDEFDNMEDDENGVGYHDAEPDSSPELHDDGRKGRNGKKILIMVSAVVVIALVATGMFFWMRMNNTSDSVPGGERNRSSLGTSDTDTNPKTTSAGTAIDAQFLDSAGVPDYYMVLKNDMTADQKTKADAAAVALAPSNTDSALSSKSANPNLTDDESKAYNSDKTMNPNYSYLTAENVSIQVRDDIERIINPIYGGWSSLQSPSTLKDNATPIAGFSDMFTSSDGKASAVSSATISNASGILPLFADWNGDNFGGRYPSRSYLPIVGTAGALNCTYNIQGTKDDSISCTTTVTYHAEMGDGSTKSESKQLTLNYKPNYDDNTGSRRIMIDSVQQN